MPSVSRFRARPLLAAVFALGLLGAPAAGGTAAAAADDAVELTPATVDLFASPREPVLHDDDSELQIDVLVGNPGEQPLPETAVEVALDPRPLETIDDLDGVFPEHPIELADAQIGATAAETDQRVTVTVPRDRLPFTSATESGVYLLRVALGAEADVTVPLVWQGAASTGRAGASAEAPSVRLGTIVPIVLPSDIFTLPTRSQLEELTPGWSDLLDEARAAQATLAIDPRVIAGIRAYGDEAPEPARQFLARLEASTLSSFLLQFADADPSAQADLGFTALMQPTSLDFVTRFGSFSADDETGDGTDAGETPGSSAGEQGGDDADPPASDDATNTGDGTSPGDEPASQGGDAGPTEGDRSDGEPVPTQPTLEQLLSWDATAAVAWPAEGSADQGTLELLRLANIDAFVLDSDNIDRASGGPRVSLEQGSALITDAALADAARTALSAPNEVQRAAGVSRLSAHLLLAAQNGSEDLVLGLDRGAVGDAEDPALLVEQLRALDWVAPTGIADLDEGEALLRGSDTLEERRELLRAAVGRESSVSELGAVLVHPEYLSGYQRARLLELFATRHAAPGVDFDEVASRYRERDAELLEGVRAITTERMQLVGATTRVPVQLHNSLPFEAVVDVQVVPASAALAVQEPRFASVAVPAEGNERVLVPVHSRLSSGESGLVVTVAATSGDLTVFTGTLPISIRSGVETIALVVLGALASLLLGFGIWRSVRRRRRASALARSGTAEGDADDSGRRAGARVTAPAE